MHRSEKAAMSVRFRPSAPREGSSEVERLVANEKVAGSSPVPRSNTTRPKLAERSDAHRTGRGFESHRPLHGFLGEIG